MVGINLILKNNGSYFFLFFVFGITSIWAFDSNHPDIVRESLSIISNPTFTGFILKALFYPTLIAFALAVISNEIKLVIFGLISLRIFKFIIDIFDGISIDIIKSVFFLFGTAFYLIIVYATSCICQSGSRADNAREGLLALFPFIIIAITIPIIIKYILII